MPAIAEGACGRSRPGNQSNRRRRSPTAWSTSARRRASCSRSDSRTASRGGATRPRPASANPRRRWRRGSCSSATSAACSTPFARRDGKAAWTFKTEGEIKSSPVVVGDRVLIGSYDGNLYALEVKTGKLAWKVTDRELRPRHAGRRRRRRLHCRLRRGLPRHPHRRRQGALHAADWRLHRRIGRRWSRAIAPTSAPSATRCSAWTSRARKVAVALPASRAPVPVLLVGGRVGGQGRRSAGATSSSTPSRRRRARRAWTFTTRARVESSPAIAGARVYVGSNDGRFYVLDLASGKQLWEYEAGSPDLRLPGARRRPRGRRHQRRHHHLFRRVRRLGGSNAPTLARAEGPAEGAGFRRASGFIGVRIPTSQPVSFLRGEIAARVEIARSSRICRSVSNRSTARNS